MGRRFRLVDLSAPLSDRVHEIGAPKIKRLDHRRGGRLLALGAILSLGEGWGAHLRDLLAALFGWRRLWLGDFPEAMGLALDYVRSDTHSGTHLDAPWHFGPQAEGRPARTIDQVPLEWCVGDGVVLDFRHKPSGSAITVPDLQQALARIDYQLKAGDVVLLLTGADRYYLAPAYEHMHCGLTGEATLWLLEQGVRVIGTDGAGLDRPWAEMTRDFLARRKSSLLWPAHFVGRRKEYCHLEKMANLDQLPPYGFKVTFFPVKVERAGAGWARVVAWVPVNEEEAAPNG